MFKKKLKKIFEQKMSHARLDCFSNVEKKYLYDMD
jgi:hypothetical protein